MKPTKKILYFLSFFSLIIYIFGFLFSYDYLISDLSSKVNRFSSIRSIAEYGLMYISFLVFCVFLYKNKYTKIFSFILLFLVSINSFISYCCYFVYGSGFNIGMAVSVLDSNIAEAMNMVTSYIAPLCIALVMLGINIILVIKCSKYLTNKYLKLFSIIWIVLPGIFLLKHHFIGAKGGSPMVKNTFYHFRDFKGAYELQKRMNGVKDNVVNYTYKKSHEGIENLIVLIGESGRRQNMSLYGYSRNTTPEQLKEKENMYIFKDANSPAGITNLSIPLTMSLIEPDHFENDFEKMSDNVINLANNYGYNTTWLSTQNNIKGVTEIASFSKNKMWINGYDVEILPQLKETLQQKGKKLILLHINGSHPNPCLRYPDNETYFNEDNEFDCYDNSIHYTDRLIGQIFKELKGKNAALVYFTDHGLKQNDGKLIHTDSKESTKVPFYVWFARKEQQNSYNFTKPTDKPVSIMYLYPLVMNLIGLDEVKLDKIEENKYLRLNHSSVLYKDLND